jgi:hypothetical protein
LLTGLSGFPIVMLTRRNAAASGVARALEVADDDGYNLPILDPSRNDVLSYSVPLPHEIPVPDARPSSHGEGESC